EICLIDGARASELAAVDDDQSGLIERPALLAIPSAAATERGRREAVGLAHCAHLIPVVASSTQAVGDDIACGMDDPNRAQRRDVQGGAGALDETCNPRVDVGACGGPGDSGSRLCACAREEQQA